ncbi:MAG: c-type cytochrome [Chloroflexi bacterium]|nr:MAG: c-type cytochrome [Chloroflexota bacterium]
MSRPSTSFTEPLRLPRPGRIVPGLARVRKRRNVPRAIAWIALAVALVESAGLLYPRARALALSLEETPAARGQRLAASLGCFSCHGPAGVGGTHNPGSEEGEVPAFGEQTQMMYVKGADDLREYILDGAPQRKREDPDYQAKVQAAALRMPAYRAFVSASQVEDLVAYLRATSGQVLPDAALAARGAEIAGELSCFSCHGPLGAGGIANPGSFKGYIPGFWDRDFDELVRDDGELHAWIGKGELPRISNHPIGRIFFHRQAIKMPRYEDVRPQADLDALVAYVRWIRAGTWRTRASAAAHH